MKTIEASAGNHIGTVIVDAVTVAREAGEDVSFEFNGQTITVTPDTDPSAKLAEWEQKHEARRKAYRESSEGIAETQRQEEQSARDAERQSRNPFVSEEEMRAAKVPWCRTAEELAAYIGTLTERPHDYGTCVYAMSMAAVAAYNYVSSVVGATGFQASCADMDILRRTRQLEGPFLIIKAEDFLYPQYSNSEKLQSFAVDTRPWLKERAQELIAKHTGSKFPPAAPVIERWQNYASLVVPAKPDKDAAA